MEGVKLNESVARRLRTVCGHARVSMRGRQATGDAAIDITADNVVVVLRVLLIFLYFTLLPVCLNTSFNGRKDNNSAFSLYGISLFHCVV